MADKHRAQTSTHLVSYDLTSSHIVDVLPMVTTVIMRRTIKDLTELQTSQTQWLV